MAATPQPAGRIPICYTEKPNGDILITTNAHQKCQRGDVLAFDLANCDATDFTVTFKNGHNPFNDNGSGKIHKANPHTGACKGNDGIYEYTVVLTTKKGTTVTFDPVIIVEGP